MCSRHLLPSGIFALVCGMGLSLGWLLQARAADDPVAEVFKKADQNGDQLLTLQEYQSGPGDPRTRARDFRLFDFDENQQLSSAEFAAIPGLVPAAQRGAIPDPFDDLLEQAVAAMDDSYENWDKHPEKLIPSQTFALNYLASISPTGRRVYDDTVMSLADENGDRRTSREEARRFLEIQLGMRDARGREMREPNGRVASLIRFLWVDQNRDDQLSHAEFLERWGGSAKEQEFERGDLNHDGQISFAEFQNPEWVGHDDPIESFLRADTDRDGLVDPDELLKAAWSSQKVLAPMMFPAMDDDGDGKLSLTEYRLSMFGNRICNWSSIPTDTNRDLKLQFEEFKFDRGECRLLWRMYFHRFDTDGDGTLSHDEYAFQIKHPNGLHVVNVDGSDLHEIYVNPDFPNCGSPDVSPDGQSILFDGFSTAGIGGSRIFKVTIDGKNMQNLCSGLMPTWSPDGTQFACSRYEGRSGVWIMNIDGSEGKKISEGWGGQWSPDGKTIAFARNGGFSAYDVKTEKIREVLNSKDNPYPGSYWNMCWSPDSQRLAYRGQSPNGIVLASISMVGDDPDVTAHYESTNSFDQDIEWSPDGEQILISMNSPERKMRTIYAVKLNSKAPPQPVPGFEDQNMDCVCAVYTPDGQRLIVGTRKR